jgi:hypothetical protein
MQNPIDGMLEEISKEQFDKIDEARKKGLEEELGKFRDGTPVRPDVAKYQIGEVVEINGGFFRIRKITKKDLILRGIPKPVEVSK